MGSANRVFGTVRTGWRGLPTGSATARLVVVLAMVAASLTVLTPSARADRTPGEVVHYRFTEGAGSTVADSGSGAPLDLTIANPGNVSWVPGGGLTLDASTVLSSGGAATKVTDAVTASNEVTVEAWVAPANTTQDGPARIVSVSGGALNRNVTLAQGRWGNQPKTVFDARLRTTSTGANGTPATTTPTGTVSTDLQHVVFTRAANGTTAIHVDGVEVVSATRGGDLSNWFGAYPLRLGNEAEGNRPWLGTFCGVAIYDVALTAGQVGDNFDAGCVVGANADPVVTDLGDQANAEGDVVSLQVVASDDDGDELAFTADGLPDGLAIDPDSGEIVGTIGQQAAAGSTFAVTVTAEDGRGGSGSATFDWVVSAVNVAPVLDPIGNLLSSVDVELSVTFTASDVDGDTLAFDATGLPDGLSIGAGGEVTGTPTTTGDVEVTATVSDGDLSDDETFTWSIIGNDPPVVTDPGAQSNDEGDVVSLQVEATDPDGDELAYTASGLPDGLSIDADSGEISGTIGQQAAGDYSTQVTATDPTGADDTVTFDWAVAAVNVAPQVAAIADRFDDVGDDVSLAVAATDVDGDTLAYDATGLPAGVSIDADTGVISGTIADGADAGSPYDVTVTVDDGTDTTQVQFTWEISVVTGPQPLVAYDFTEGSGSTVADSGTGTPLDLTIANPGNVSWVAGGGLSLDASTVLSSGGAATKVTDAVTASNEVTVEAWVAPANTTQDGPARIVSVSGGAVNRNVTLAQGRWGNQPKTVFDARLRTTSTGANGTPATTTPTGTVSTDLQHVVFTRAANGATAIHVDGVEVVSATRGGDLSNWFGAYPLRLGNEAEGNRPWLGTFCGVAIYDVALTAGQVGDKFDDTCVLGANADPVVTTPGAQANDEGDVVSLPIGASDADGDDLTFMAAGLPDGLAIDPDTGVIAGTIGQQAADGSPYDVTVTVTDDRGGSGSANFDWTVDVVNVAPVLDPIGNLLSSVGVELSVTFTASDVDGDTLAFDATGLPDGLSIDADGTVTGTPTTQGDATVTVSVTAGDLTDDEEFTWSIVGNDAPVLDAIGDQANDEGDDVDLAVTASDGDGDTLTFDATGLPDGLSIAADTGTITGTVTQTAAADSPYTTTVTVNDGLGGSDDETFTWTITAVNLAPQVDPIDDQDNDVGDDVDLAVVATDGDDDTLAYDATGLPDGLTIDPTSGVISGTIADGAEAGSPYDVAVTVDDGTETTQVAFTWTISVVTGPQPVVAYDFTEGSGSTVADSGAGTPLDLTIADAANTTWIPGGGLTVTDSTTISSGAPATKVTDAVSASDEITLEAWIAPANTTQDGPARVVSISEDSLNRNVTLGQGQYSSLPDTVFDVRLRTTDTNNNGQPSTTTPADSISTDLTHVVFTRATDGTTTIYLDGVEVASEDRGGDLSDWSGAFPLLLANEAEGNRPWLGTYCEVAIYDVALSAAQVGDSFDDTCALDLPAEVQVQVTPGGGIGATTFGNSSITVSNDGGAGAEVASVSFDLRGSVVPDATFDPIGTAGDEGTQCLAVSAGAAATGFVAPGDPCTDPFSLPHEDAPGVVGNGWDGMTLDFTDFDPGESIVLGVDVDPTTIQGVPGSGGAGAVSGLELTGSTVTVTLEDGRELVGQLFGDGSNGGGEVVLSTTAGQVVPTGIEMLGVSTNPTVFPNDSVAGSVAAAGPQVVRVSGPVGADVQLLSVAGEYPEPNAFDLDPFESDEATTVAYPTGTIGADGHVDIDVTLADDTLLHHFVATIDDGATGPLTQILVIGIGDTETPTITPIQDVTVQEGNEVSVAIQASDPTDDALTLSLASTPDIEALGATFVDAGDGTATLTWQTEVGDLGTYDVEVTATDDGGNTAVEAFTIDVVEPNDVPGQALVEVTPNGGLGASTFGAGSIAVENVGATDAPAITSVFVDLRGSIVPDATLDPNGDAGDATAKCLEVSSGATATGYVTPADNCVDPFSIPHEDAPGVVGNGFDGMTLDFTDFGVGDSLGFAIDIDPTTIQGVGGAGGAGAVSGLELAGTPVTVTFADGSVATSRLFGDGSAGGGLAAVTSAEVTTPAPTLEMLDLVTVPTVFENGSNAGNVAATGAQTIRVTGPVGASVTLLDMTGAFPAANAFDLDEFESDDATAVDYLPASIGADGFVDIQVTISDDTSLHHYVASVDDGVAQLTDILVVGVGDPVDPDPDVLYRVNAGGPEVAATDGGPAWDGDQATNLGGTAVAGPPSPYWIAGSDNAYGTADAIDLSDPSVPAGTPEALFQTERWDDTGGDEMTYEFPVGAGQSYTVDLYFSAIFETADDFREFAVEIEGETVLDAYDIHELVGHDAGVVATVQTPDVGDDFLTITFVHQVQNPKVNAIEVRGAAAPQQDQPPTVGAIADQSVQVGSTLDVPITTSEPDGDPITLTWSSTPDASAFATLDDAGNGTGTLGAAPAAGDVGTYDVTVTATDVDGSDDETFTLTVTDPPAPGTTFARINAGGAELTAVDGGDPWEADQGATGHPYLTDPGSGDTNGFPAVEPGPTVPSNVPAGIFDTERWSSSGFGYGVPVPSGTQVYVRLFLGNGFPGTSEVGQRVYDVSIDGAVVADDLDLVEEFGHLQGGMLEYLVTSDGTVDVAFANVVENPLLNGLEIVSAESSPDTLGASPTSVDFGTTLVNGSKTESVTLSNLGFDVGDPGIEITSVEATGGEFSTDFSGPVTVPAGGSTTVGVTFAPTSTGAQSGTLSVVHSGSNTPVEVALSGVADSDIPVSFTSEGLAGESSNNPTSLQFGPDGRLYVAQQNAVVYAYTVERNGVGDYSVTGTEQISLVKNTTPNHDDDGGANATTQRQSTGLLVSGTAENPVLYVSSSDWRISVGSDSGLDTNSGVISRLSWNGSDWDKVDIVRGLPRSEENHSTNGMELDEATNTLYIMQGGHANKGAPGNNFSGTPEYYLSAAMLQVDLDAIDALPVTTDTRTGTQVAYDLPTLNDPDRADITNADAAFPFAVGHPRYDDAIDVGDPFGGNNAQNQAIPEPGGPVQIYSPGYRNAYDVVLTENGRLYTSDNGPNSGWGGLPLIYANDGTSKGFGEDNVFDLAAGDYCTNEFNDGGSTAHGDPLHFVNGEGYYGGHPAPIRAFPGQSGVLIYDEVSNGNWSEIASYEFGDLLPDGLTLADFPDNPIECDYTSNDPAKYVDIINASTNGITEYTASNFGGALQGNIMTASFNGNIYSYGMNAAGDAFVDKEALFSGFGSQPLDVTAQGDDDPFPGTVWAATYGSDNITVFEPVDFGTTCEGTDDPLLDEDNDGYSNADEIDNGTNPCSAGSQPTDNDGDLVSDLNDPDDDDDGTPDVQDAFALDPDDGTTTSLPVSRSFAPGDPGFGFFGLGLTGLMSNGTTDYLDQYDPGNLDAGGATGKFGVESVSAGDAYQTDNTQDNGFQYGIDVDGSTAPFVVESTLESPFFDGQTPQNFQSLGVFIGPGTQNDYLKVVMNANGGAGGVQVLLEEADIAASAETFGSGVTGDLLGASSVDLSVVVDPAALTAQARVAPNGGTPVDLGAPVDLPASWFDGTDDQGLAVGLISTSTGSGPEFTAAWDNLDVSYVAGSGPLIDAVADITVEEGATDSIVVDVTDGDGDALTIDVASTPDAATLLTEDLVENAAGDYTLTLDLAPEAGDAGDYAVTISADDGTNAVVEEAFTVSVVEPAPTSDVLYRVNAGGPEVAAADASSPNWSADTDAAPSPYRTAGGPNVYASSSGNAHPGAINMSDASLPPSVPVDVFEVERWDPAAAPEMLWQFPVDAGTEVEVRLFFAELFSGVDAAGERVFDVSVEGTVPTEFDDIDQFATAGAKGAFMVSSTEVVEGDTLDVEFLHDVIENPAIKGIEVVAIGGVPTIDLVAPTDGATIDTDEVLVEWDLGGVLDPQDHVHVTLDDEPHTSVFRPDSSLLLTGLTDGPHTITVEVANVAHEVYTNPEASDAADITVDTAPEPQDPLVVDAWTHGDVLHRVNAGGPEVAATDSGPAWGEDQVAAGNGGTAGTGVESPLLDAVYAAQPNGEKKAYGSADPITVEDSVPADTPVELFQTERWDPPTGEEVGYDFAVPTDTIVEVRVYLAELFQIGTPGTPRAFDIQIDGTTVATDVNPLADQGHDVGYMLPFVVTSDGTVDVDLLHVSENPAVKAIEVVELVTVAEAEPGDDVEVVARIANPAGNTADAQVQSVGLALDGGTAEDIAGDCPDLATDLAPGEALDCRTTFSASGSADEVITAEVEVTADFIGGDAGVASTSNAVSVTLVDPPSSPVLARINAGGPTVTATDGGPDWEADDSATPGHPFLAIASGSSLGGFSVPDRTADVPAYVPQGLYQTERWDGTNGAAPDDLTWEIPVAVGGSATVNLYMANGWAGADQPGEREFDVLVEGALVLDEFDLSATYGHATGGIESFNVTDDGDGVITIVFEHGTGPQNPLVNAIEVRTD